MTDSDRATARRPVALVASFVVAALMVIPTSAAAATTPSSSTEVLFVGHHLEVVAATDQRTGCSRVFLTSDYVHWRNVTPSTPSAPCRYSWISASFVTSRRGWLLARDEASITTILEATTNAGRSWSRRVGGTTGSNAGTQVIDFVSAKVGFRQQFAWGSNSHTLERTADGGMTWTVMDAVSGRGCPDITDVFATAKIGYAASELAGSSTGIATTVYPYLWRTLDGGATWTRFGVPRPPSVPAGTPGLYGRPAFHGRDGTFAVVYPVQDHQDVYFFSSSDAGQHWRIVNGLVSPLAMAGTVTVDAKLGTHGCGSYATSVKGPLVSVGVATPSIWWVLLPGRQGNTERVIVQDGGFSTYITSELPRTTHGARLWPLDARNALLTVTDRTGRRTVYSTADGGVTWVALHAPTTGGSYTTPVALPPHPTTTTTAAPG